MILHRKLALGLTLGLSAVAAHAGSVVYVLTDGQQFGTIDLSTGSFTPIGSGIPVDGGGLVQGPGGSLLSLGFDGTLNSINPITGTLSAVGATGLGDCSTAASPCGSTSVNTFGKLGSNYYATDFANQLYSVDPATGKATSIGLTGIPALSFIPHSPVPGDPDGSFYIYDESLFASGGNLYASFDTGTLDPTTFTPTWIGTANLYQINPATGHASFVTNIPSGLASIVSVDGTTFALDAATSELLTLNLSTGKTAHVADLDPGLGPINGSVAPVPEPASLALVGSGLAAFAAAVRRRQWRNS